MTKTIIATRKSPLALVQAEATAAWIRRALGHETELLKIVTTGDRQAEWSLEKTGGKGLFTKELEEALKRGDAQMAVHSSKDLPGIMEPGLAMAGYLPREDARDVLVLRAGIEIPKTIATSSPRRRLQIGMLFPDLSFTVIRGNVDTRLKKIAEQNLADGTILAAAGLRRLGIDGWPGLDFHILPVESMVPAVGQGAIALQVRADLVDLYRPVLDAATARAQELERAFQNALGAGCHTAFAAHVAGDSLFLFHEAVGLRSVPLSAADLDEPDATAAAVLDRLGLKPA